MRVWRKKQKWQVIAALLFAVWILMGTRKINVNAENMEAESFTGETAVETEEETTKKTVTAGIGYRAASADSECKIPWRMKQFWASTNPIYGGSGSGASSDGS